MKMKNENVKMLNYIVKRELYDRIKRISPEYIDETITSSYYNPDFKKKIGEGFYINDNLHDTDFILNDDDLIEMLHEYMCEGLWELTEGWTIEDAKKYFNGEDVDRGLYGIENYNSFEEYMESEERCENSECYLINELYDNNVYQLLYYMIDEVVEYIDELLYEIDDDEYIDDDDDDYYDKQEIYKVRKVYNDYIKRERCKKIKKIMVV